MTRRLKDVVDEYMKKVSGIEELCDRCLQTARWDGNVVLMVVDAAFTSIGLNYFTAVVPNVVGFKTRFVDNGLIPDLGTLAQADIGTLRRVWKNKRSWQMARDIASYLSGKDDRGALRRWAGHADLDIWEQDPLGAIHGVGINTFQYLRMMGGVDTVMPDKIVKRVINEIFEKAGARPVQDDLAFVKTVERIAPQCGYRPIELCWMTWMIQPEGKLMRMKKYAPLLPHI